VPYYISISTYGNYDIFNNNYACELLLNVLSYNKYALDYRVYGFVIMPDQLHIVFQPCKVPIHQVVRKNTANFTRYYQKIWGISIPIWGLDYYESPIKDYTALKQVQDEIHLKPEQLCSNTFREYYYSSYRVYNVGSEEFMILLDRLQE
jgi:REP element-mobilizing transposase RayT